MNIKDYVRDMGQRARVASRKMATMSTFEKNDALSAIAGELERSREFIKAENKRDLDAGRANKLDSALLDRLELNDKRIDAMIEGLNQVMALPDPCGEITDLKYRPSGIQVGKQRVPLGVVSIIYESRPNVTIDAAALCLKSGNAGILRGGKESIHSNRAISQCIKLGLGRSEFGIPADAIQVVDTTDRAVVGELITSPECVDIVIPRGGKGLIERISADAKVSVIKHLDGICHVYIDEHADINKAIEIADNSKTHRYGVCNAMETLLVHRSKAEDVLPQLAERLQNKSVELRGCERTAEILPQIIPAVAEDWDTEYLAPILSIKVVETFDEAVSHINTHSSAHTDAIVTENYSLTQRFLNEVDSSSVMINASTRFADGFEYGLGAEIGISTDKIHARGPVGLEGLTSQKWIVLGDGHVRN